MIQGISVPNKIQAVYRYMGWLAGSGFFSEHSKHMFHPKHIAAVLIAMCLASTGDAATRLEPPDVELVDAADHLVEAAEAEFRHQLAHFFGNKEE